ncbi:hypothetical protein E2C01_005561 [Portunus trituberculatus]|uniref:Uncharacterized protein n=1 Tax=Portunus trituberculatus TaxID=210409 RepID=A0A5B7CSR5_PORTR|nr:hypothetical protein [Portunus trituberculatus]
MRPSTKEVNRKKPVVGVDSRTAHRGPAKASPWCVTEHPRVYQIPAKLNKGRDGCGVGDTLLTFVVTWCKRPTVTRLDSMQETFTHNLSRELIGEGRAAGPTRGGALTTTPSHWLPLLPTMRSYWRVVISYSYLKQDGGLVDAERDLSIHGTD